RIEPADECGAEPRSIVHHRFVHGRRLRRSWKSLGRTHRRNVDGNRQQAVGTIFRCRAGQDLRDDCLDPVYPGEAALIVSAIRTIIGRQLVLLQQPSWITSIGKNPSEDARRGAWFLGSLALVAVVVPILNQLVPPSSSFHLSAYAL